MNTLTPRIPLRILLGCIAVSLLALLLYVPHAFAEDTVSAAPQSNGISAVTALATSSTAASILWTTNEVSSSVVTYGTTTSYSATTTGPDLALDHTVFLGGLAPDTTYHYQVSSSNGVGTATSPDQTLTTLAGGAGTTTPIITAVSAIPTYTVATIMWMTAVPASSMVVYGTSPLSLTASSTGYENLSQQPTVKHSVSISNLQPGTTYYFEAVSANADDATATSTEQIFTTPSM